VKGWMRGLVALVVLAVLAPVAVRAESKPFRVGYNLWIGYAQAFIAESEGIFKKHGLDVELVAFPGPGDSLPPLIGGSLEGSLSTLDNVILMHGNGDASVVTVFQVDASAGADGIVANKEIKSVADLKGKKVAATVGQCNHLMLLMALEQAGLKESDIELINMNADDAGAAFIAGSLDAAVTWEPWLSKAVSETGANLIFTSAKVPNLIADIFAVSTKTAKERPGDVKAFIAALDEAQQFLESKPEAAAEIVAKKLEVRPADVTEMLKGVVMYDLADNAGILGTPENPGTGLKPAEAVAAFFLDKGVITTKVDAVKTIDASFIQK
jgi:NitT/TauT family transport system substrate-binding protein